MRAFRFVWFLPIAYGVFVACATAEDPQALPDGGSDTSLAPTTGGNDASSTFDATQPGFDSSVITTDSASPDVDNDAPTTCAPIGLPCDTENNFSCPNLFLYCEPWKSPFFMPDAGPPDASDAGDASDAASDADAGPPVDAGDGVCLPIPFGATSCNDGTDAGCDDGGTCLMAAQRCLTPEQAACICPSHPGACR